jgi:23S rRNA (uridine2552-2'-O)-methyltransferase
MDIGCAPGSWLQYTYEKCAMTKIPVKIVGFDIKDVHLDLDGVYTYNQDIQDTEKIRQLIAQHDIKKFDVIISDMAPNTIGFKDIDAMRSIELLRVTLPLYENFLKT